MNTAHIKGRITAAKEVGGFMHLKVQTRTELGTTKVDVRVYQPEFERALPEFLRQNAIIIASGQLNRILDDGNVILALDAWMIKPVDL